MGISNGKAYGKNNRTAAYRSGIDGPTQTKSRPLNAEETARAVSLREQGWTCQEIARRFFRDYGVGWTHQAIRRATERATD